MLKTKLLSVFAAVCVSVLAFAASGSAGVAEGKKIFDAKKCVSCHQISGPAREKTIQDQLARKGPELWYAGSKFNKEFLDAWLKDPKPIRPLEYNSLTKKNAANHAKLDAKDAADMSAYLMSLKSDDVKVPVDAKDNQKGRVLFIKKYACYGCHEVKVSGSDAGGLSAPSFIGVGGRLQTSWIYAYLSNPRAFKPVRDMPNYVGIMNDFELMDLAAYVGSIK